MKILIGIPTTGQIPVEFLNGLDNLRTEHECVRSYIARSIIHIAREQMAIQMLRDSYDALLFLDDDMIIPPDLVDRLVAQNAPITSALCFKRVPPYTPCVYETLELEGPGLKMGVLEFDTLPKVPFYVDGAGTACMLIRHEVFEKMRKPYFLPLPRSGEDLAFCIRANQAGYKVRIDPRIRVGHLETRAIYSEHYLEHKRGRQA